jgi:hypothetical protein
VTSQAMASMTSPLSGTLADLREASAQRLAGRAVVALRAKSGSTVSNGMPKHDRAMARGARLWLVLALMASVAVGCGGTTSDSTGTQRRTDAYTHRDCTRGGEIADRTLFVCYRPDNHEHGAFVLGSPASDRVLPVGLPRLPGRDVAGHWSWAAVSPDGQTLLAQWSGECEVPVTFLVGVHGGIPEAIDGASPPRGESIALGWTPGGRALVIAQSNSCPGSAPRLVQVSPTGAVLAPRVLTSHEARSLSRTSTRSAAKLLR